MNKIRSLEQWLTLLLLGVNGSLLALTLLCAWLLGASTLVLMTLLVCIVPLQYIAIEWIKHKLCLPYFRLLGALESIKVDDYSFEVLPVFPEGVSARVFDEIADFSSILSQKKRLFDEKDLLVHSLIQQLDSPVLLLDQQHKLRHGNQALSRWLGKDWRLVRFMPVSSLGLTRVDQAWGFDDQSQGEQFKIRSSHYKDASGEHQLLILTDISSELRQMQAQSWQQVVRVLSHEIKNSLTPIKSLAQTMAEFSKDPAQKQAMDVIVDRSQNLTEFVSHYSQLTRAYSISSKQIELPLLLAGITGLHPDIEFELKLELERLHADPILLEQVLINLITNASQATSPIANSHAGNGQEAQGRATIKIHSYQSRGCAVVAIVDNGSGIQNQDNLFVPFYTTKPDGQGIGLLLCRNIIEQHGGQLTLTNNQDAPGAIATIKLPQLKK